MVYDILGEGPYLQDAELTAREADADLQDYERHLHHGQKTIHLCVKLKPTVGCKPVCVSHKLAVKGGTNSSVHHDGWWLERILCWKQDTKVVQTALEFRS